VNLGFTPASRWRGRGDEQHRPAALWVFTVTFHVVPFALGRGAGRFGGRKRLPAGPVEDAPILTPVRQKAVVYILDARVYAIDATPGRCGRPL
jgi:hypothetical protein